MKPRQSLAALAIAGALTAASISPVHAATYNDSGLAACQGSWRTEPERHFTKQRGTFWNLRQAAYSDHWSYSTPNTNMWFGVIVQRTGATTNVWYKGAGRNYEVLSSAYVLNTEFRLRARMNPTASGASCHSQWRGTLTY